MKLKLLFSILLIATSEDAMAFPEMIRHGYVNCSACHQSPAGGGVLTSYGRGLSAELISTWGSENEAQFLHGKLDTEKLNEWLLVGGDLRGLQFHYENEKTKDGQWVNMQAMFELAVKIRDWTFDYAFGKFDNASRWKSNATHYYVMNQITDFVSVRLGRILPQFGLNIPEHNSPTRSTFGFGAYDERDVAEVQYSNESYSGVLSYSETNSDHRNPNEKSVSTKIEKVFGDTIKSGFSAWSGDSEKSKRQLFALHTMWGFDKKNFLLSELDWQEQITKTSGAITHSASTYNKFGHEFHKGVIGLLLLDGQLGTLEDPQTQTIHYGLGLQFFPRPHFELESVWTREKSPQLSSTEGDYAWLLFHYYL